MGASAPSCDPADPSGFRLLFERLELRKLQQELVIDPFGLPCEDCPPSICDFDMPSTRRLEQTGLGEVSSRPVHPVRERGLLSTREQFGPLGL